MRPNAHRRRSKQKLKNSIQYLAVTQGNDSNQAATPRLSGEDKVLLASPTKYRTVFVPDSKGTINCSCHLSSKMSNIL